MTLAEYPFDSQARKTEWKSSVTVMIGCAGIYAETVLH
jgi:hypothetical protein